MLKIVVLNAKGGSGKTTLASNLASHYAVQGMNPTLIDMDAQGSSTRWLSKRGLGHAPIHGIAGFERNARVTRSFALRIPQDCKRVIVDTPAALDPQRMPDMTHDADAILVPVLPSDIDIHAAAKCITDLLLVAKIPRQSQRIAVIANRVKKNTVMYRALMRFLSTLEIPILTTLRDSQNYIRAAEAGIGIFEMKPYQVREDLDHWLPVLGWLAQKDGASGAISQGRAAPMPQYVQSPATDSAPIAIAAEASQRLDESATSDNTRRDAAAAPSETEEMMELASIQTSTIPAEPAQVRDAKSASLGRSLFDFFKRRKR